MQFFTLALSLLAATSSAFFMHRPHFLDFRSPSDLDVAFMEADLATRSTNTFSRIKSRSYCATRNDITADIGALPPPTVGLSLYHIAAGRGTQNYSCPAEASPDSAPIQLGAKAILFNITCLKAAPLTTPFNKLYTRLATGAIPQDGNPNESGHHFFTNGNVTATFNLHTDYLTGNLGISFSTKTANVSAPADAAKGPDGSDAVSWLKLTTIGDTPKPAGSPGVKIATADQVGDVQEIYRLNTVGGSAPKTCEGLVGTTFEKQYTAEYWFWH